jgi:hypothetical protein
VVVGVLVVVSVGVLVGVRLGVVVIIVEEGVKDVVGVWVAYTTRVEDGSAVEVPEG